MRKPIYFDFMATTPIDSRVIEVLIKYMGIDGVFGNAASTQHIYGKTAASAVEHARQQIASVINANID